MTQYIAFLRAINVGGHTVKMADLRQLFAAVGFANVQTYIQTGNVVFNAPNSHRDTLEQHIEDHLQNTLGYPVTTFLRTPPELAVVAHYNAFPESEFVAGAKLYMAFLKEVPGKEAQHRVQAYQNEVDEFHIHQRELYWLCRKSQSTSTFSGALLERALGSPATLRSITTVRKMVLKYVTAGA